MNLDKLRAKFTGINECAEVIELIEHVEELKEDCTAWRVRADIDHERIESLEAEAGRHDAAKCIAETKAKELQAVVDRLANEKPINSRGLPLTSETESFLRTELAAKHATPK